MEALEVIAVLLLCVFVIVLMIFLIPIMIGVMAPFVLVAGAIWLFTEGYPALGILALVVVFILVVSGLLSLFGDLFD